MPKNSRVLIAIVGIALAFVLARHFFSPGTVSSTQALFAASFPDETGKLQSMAQWRGKVLVVNFWASWCGPCREEMPMLDEFQADYGAKEVRIVGISAEDVDHLKAFSEELKVGYQLLAGDFEALALAQALGNDKSILPFTVVIDKSGKIAQIMFGKVDKSMLEKALAPLLLK
ncbi:MAG: TlpA family protein disulfide reductase [Methylophilaceae bacterium]